MSFGSRIKKLRQENNLTQRELADKLFVTRQAVTKWENDKSLPSIETLNRLSELFSVSKEYLLTGADTTNEKAPITSKRNRLSTYIKLLIVSLSILMVTIITLFTSLKIVGKPSSYDIGFYITLDEERIISSLEELKGLDTPTFLNNTTDLSYNRITYLNYLNRYTLELLLPYNKHEAFYLYKLSLDGDNLIVSEPTKYSLALPEANIVIKLNEYTILVNEIIPLTEIIVEMLGANHNILNTERIFINADGLRESSRYGIMDYKTLENHFILFEGFSFHVMTTNLLGELRSYNIYNTKQIRLCLAPYIEGAYKESYLFYFYV